MDQLVSIVVPVYNVEDYVSKCLDSLKNQSYKNIEIVIVDDGSTDSSSEICDAFAKDEPRAKVFHKTNGGLSDARNFGLKKTKGEVIAFVDSDDFVKKDYVFKMLQEMEESKSDIAVCGYDNTTPKKEVLSGEKATARLLVRQENVDILAWNKLYKKNLFIKNNVEFPKGQNHEDILTIYKVMSKAKKVVFVDEALYNYVERGNSITNKEKTEEKLIKREQAAREAIQFFDKEKKLKDAAKVSLLLSQYAYLDFALNKKIDKEYVAKARGWILSHKKDYSKNAFMTKKLKLYNTLISIMGGKLYFLFRKVRHE